MKRALTTTVKILCVLAAAWVHSGAVSYLVFFGSVVNPQWLDYLMQGIAFIMLLPFVPFIYLPGAMQAHLDEWILLFSSLAWGGFYLWLFLRCSRRYFSSLPVRTTTPTA